MLEEARRRGFLGPGPVESHVEHAEGFARSAPQEPQLALDLGSGGGLPGLVLAARWLSSSWVLLDSQLRRTAFLEEAVINLGWQDRVRVVRARAEEAGRDSSLRGTFDLVTSRSFGPPATTAECASPLLTVGGHLVVSDPPGGGEERWPSAGIEKLGLDLVSQLETSVGHFTVLRQVLPCPSPYPRADGRPHKRPLF